jgi:crotonobetainyl-CoA:carnitine CoA-transferase CaiB-like acyl-CoA transferase
MLSLGDGMPRLPWADLIASYRAALGLAAAMDSVARGGAGRRIVVPMMEAVTEVQSLLIREYREQGHVPSPGSTLFNGKYPCYRLYPTADGKRIAVGAIETKFWERVCAVVGRPDLLPEAYAEGDRAKRAIAALEGVFSTRPLTHWVEAFRGEDCCVEPVLTYPEVY